jgi:hypothetical protein
MMNNYYVVGAYCTSHWVTVIICMKFKEVWCLDSAKQHPPLKFPDLQTVLNWSVSCRFCSQKFNLLVFLIGIADHAGPLVQYFLFTKNQSLSVSNWYYWSCRAFGDAQDKVTKGKKKKPKATLKHKTNLAIRLRFFYGPLLPIWYCINLSFGTSMQCAQQPRGSSLCGFHVAFHMLRLLDDIPDIKKAAVRR